MPEVGWTVLLMNGVCNNVFSLASVAAVGEVAASFKLRHAEEFGALQVLRPGRPHFDVKAERQRRIAAKIHTCTTG